MDYPSNEILERICDAHWNNREGDGVKFNANYMLDACNHLFSGTIEHDGVSYGFVIQNGNWNGTEVKEWGLADDVGIVPEPEPQELLTFVPKDTELKRTRPQMFGVYMAWRKEKWFTEKEQGLNYDTHFQPGSKTRNYYEEWANKKGMTIGRLSNL